MFYGYGNHNSNSINAGKSSAEVVNGEFSSAETIQLHQQNNFILINHHHRIDSDGTRSYVYDEFKGSEYECLLACMGWSETEEQKCQGWSYERRQVPHDKFGHVSQFKCRLFSGIIQEKDLVEERGVHSMIVRQKGQHILLIVCVCFT